MKRGELGNMFYIILAVIVIIVTTAGYLYFETQEKEENNQTQENNETTQNNTQIINEVNNTNNEENNTSTIIIQKDYDYNISKVSELDQKACGAGRDELINWFGEPMHPMGWEYTETERGEENSWKFFVWNDSVIYTKGKMNYETGKIETYNYLARENLNRTVQKIVEC